VLTIHAKNLKKYENACAHFAATSKIRNPVSVEISVSRLIEIKIPNYRNVYILFRLSSAFAKIQ